MYNNFAAVYDSLAFNSQYSERAEYVADLLKKRGKNQGILLDLGCGTGNFSVAFSDRGFDVIAVDISPECLCEAQNKANGRNILFLCQDMTELDLYGTIDCCICLFDTLNHLPDKAAFEKAIARVSLFMNPGGVFIFDVNTEYKHKFVLANNTFVIDTDDVYLVWRNSTAGSLETRLKLDFFIKNPDGTFEKRSDSFTERPFETKYIKSVLENNGFCNISAYKELTEDEPDEHTQRIFFVAEKEK